MKFSDLKRDRDFVLKHLVEQEDGSVYCTKPCKIYAPTKWEGTPLMNLDDGNNGRYVFALFIIVIENKYTLINAMGRMQLAMGNYLTIEMDGIECFEFYFDEGDVVIQNLGIVQDNTILYYDTETILNKGNVVPYLEYNDSLLMLSTASSIGGIGLPNATYASIYISHCWRSIKDKTKLARQVSSGEPIIQIGFRNVMYSTAGGFGKLNGSYLDEGINSLLVNPSSEIGEAESILRL